MKKLMSLTLSAVMLASLTLPLAVHADDNRRLSPRTKTVLQDAGIGAAVGAGVGVVANQKNGRSTWKNAGIGAAVGAGMGAIVGWFRTRDKKSD